MRRHTQPWDAWDFEGPMHEDIEDKAHRYQEVEDGIIQDWEALFLDGVDESYDEEEVEL